MFRARPAARIIVDSMVDEYRQRARLRWPAGYKNQAALLIGLALFCMTVGGLIAQLFFEHRLKVRKPIASEMAFKAIQLAFAIVLLSIRTLREKYRLILAAIFLISLAMLMIRIVPFLPSQWHVLMEVIFSLLACSAAAAFVVGLLHGERLDEFFSSVRRFLLKDLFGIDPAAKRDT